MFASLKNRSASPATTTTATATANVSRSSKRVAIKALLHTVKSAAASLVRRKTSSTPTSTSTSTPPPSGAASIIVASASSMLRTELAQLKATNADLRIRIAAHRTLELQHAAQTLEAEHHHAAKLAIGHHAVSVKNTRIQELSTRVAQLENDLDLTLLETSLDQSLAATPIVSAALPVASATTTTATVTATMPVIAAINPLITKKKQHQAAPRVALVPQGLRSPLTEQHDLCRMAFSLSLSLIYCSQLSIDELPSIMHRNSTKILDVDIATAISTYFQESF
jgi:hypothetical protein